MKGKKVLNSTNFNVMCKLNQSEFASNILIISKNTKGKSRNYTANITLFVKIKIIKGKRVLYLNVSCFKVMVRKFLSPVKCN